jgi:hypothetical protein
MFLVYLLSTSFFTSSQFTAWATFTTGQLIGADSSLASNYLSVLSQFAKLGFINLPDQESQNRYVCTSSFTIRECQDVIQNTFDWFGCSDRRHQLRSLV